MNHTILLLIYGGFVLSLIASILIRVLYKIYSLKENSTGISAIDAANIIIENEDFPVEVVTISGFLNDYFDPSKNIVALSKETAKDSSIASVAVAVHEMGHVAQKFNGNILFKIRSSIVRMVNFTTQIGYIMFILGIAINALNMAYIGLILFLSSFVFLLITFPIEIDASLKGLRFIKKYKLLSQNELVGAVLILSAAALTYFAALVQNLGQVLRMLSILSSKKE